MTMKFQVTIPAAPGRAARIVCYAQLDEALRRAKFLLGNGVGGVSIFDRQGNLIWSAEPFGAIAAAVA